MKVIIFWDIYWRVWRKAFKKELSNLSNLYNPDFIIANVDNITSWRWAIEKLMLKFEKLWVDVLTWWDHIFDHENHILDYLGRDNSILLRPANFYETNYYKIPGVWYKIFSKKGKNLLVIHLLWEAFMKYNVYNPFLKAEEIISSINPNDYDWIIVDFHKETTAEGYGLWAFLDWKVSFIAWTHTHIQTNDDIILKWWTWFISDIWMVWSLDSIIGADYLSVKKRFITWINKWKIEQKLSNNYILSAVYLEIENKKCIKIEKIRINGNF